MVMLSKFKGHTGIYQVLPSAKAATYRQHGIFIGPVEGTYSYCMGIFIITVTCCKIPFIIRIKILGMKSRQCCSPCTDSIYPVT